jgi:hypothetical protein
MASPRLRSRAPRRWLYDASHPAHRLGQPPPRRDRAVARARGGSGRGNAPYTSPVRQMPRAGLPWW